MHSLLPRVIDVRWAALPEPGEVWATTRWPDLLCRVPPGPRRDLLHKVAREADRLAEGWEHNQHPRTLVPPLAACRRQTAASSHAAPPPPPNLPARLPWAGDLRRLLGLGASGPSGLGATADLRACDVAPPLNPPLTSFDRQPLSWWVGLVPPPPSPR